MIQTFIVCHDPRVIEHYEKTNHFGSLKDYTYILVGQQEYNGESNKVIIARALPVNIEDRKNLLVYTAWYAILENNLITKDWIRLLEYDTIVNTEIEEITEEILTNYVSKPTYEIGVWGHIPYQMNNYHFIQNREWIESLDAAMKKVYSVSIKDLFADFTPEAFQNSYWMGTSNILFSKKEMKSFVEWYKPLADLVYTDPKAGHGLERALTFYCIHQEKPFNFIQHVIQHHQLNSHGTQQAGAYEENVKKILG